MAIIAPTLASLWLLSLALSCVGSPSLPEPFNEMMIAGNQYGDSKQYIEHLGTVARLPTIVGRSESIRCKFVIQTRAHQPTEVAFEPRTLCFGQSYHHCTNAKDCSTYQFDVLELQSSGFNANERTVILIAGFMSDDNVDWFDEIANLWLRAENVNIIRVSWSEGDKYIYRRAASGVPIVAREITILLHYLAALNGWHLNDAEFAKRVQIVGHSLGGHIAGFVGQDLGGKLGRITALDPAGPFFDNLGRQFRLDPSDALFVQAIHTNSGQIHYLNTLVSAPMAALDWAASKLPVIGDYEKSFKENLNRESNTAWFGINQQVSHVDYYANNGRVQPGCESLMHICDHGRAHEIYRDLLAHETRLLTEFGPEARRKNRLLAFSSDDYENFKVGKSIHDKCPEVMDFNEHQGIEGALTQCSLPLDLLATADQVVEEFGDKFGLDGLRSSQTSQAKYYFSTRAQSPLVGHHYLLKIRTGYENGWTSNCRVMVEVTMSDGLRTNLTMLEDFDHPSSFDGLMVHHSAVFVLPNRRNEPILAGTDASGAGASYLPQEVHLQVQGAKEASVTKVLLSKAYDFFTRKSHLDSCYLNIESIEIMPLIGSQHAVRGSYGDTPERLDEESDIVRRISQVSVN